MDAVNGRYRLIRRVGEGGTGVVYQAADTLLGRTVALKALHDRCAVELLRREGRSLARISHPHVVALHDLVEDHGRSYLVMEYVDGCNLDQWLGEHRSLHADQAIETFRAVALAVHEAHLRGILHCDIKPANVLISTRGEIKLSDFTLAHLLAANEFHGPRGGTVSYAAPEQLAGDSVDERTDVYGLGALLYRLAGAVQEDTPICAELVTAAATALAPIPANRFPTVRAMLEALPLGNGEATTLASPSTVSDLTRVVPITAHGALRGRPARLALPAAALSAVTVLAGVAAVSHFTAQASPARVMVPDLVASPGLAAEHIVHSLALRYRVRQAYSATVPANTVMVQIPQAGQVPVGTTITMVVSKGPAPVSVPDLNGLSEDRAITDLRRLGFKVVIQTQDTVFHDAGTILDQTPLPHTTQPHGSTVTFTVSTRPWYWPF